MLYRNFKTAYLRWVTMVLVTICCCPSIFAQSSPVSTGGEATGTNGSVSFSAGQVAYINFASETGSITQGVQQAYEIFTSGTEVNNFLSGLRLTAYPNPTTNYLNLYVADFQKMPLYYKLYDEHGHLIIHAKIDGNNTRISLAKLQHASYFLEIISKGRLLNTFQIIKN